MPCSESTLPCRPNEHMKDLAADGRCIFLGYYGKYPHILTIVLWFHNLCYANTSCRRKVVMTLPGKVQTALPSSLAKGDFDRWQ